MRFLLSSLGCQSIAEAQQRPAILRELFEICPVYGFGFLRVAFSQKHRSERVSHRLHPIRGLVVTKFIFQSHRFAQPGDGVVQPAGFCVDLPIDHQGRNGQKIFGLVIPQT